MAITNRQVIHDSFANISKKWRVTFNFGFHKKSSVLNIKGGDIHSPPTVYDENHIFERSKIIMYAINKRKKYFRNETPYKYHPLSSSKEDFNLKNNISDSLFDYNLLDLSI